MNDETTALIRKKALFLTRKYIQKGSGSNISNLLNENKFNTLEIEKIIRKTKFVIVGGVATQYYMPQRYTIDTDVLVLTEDKTKIYEELEKANCLKINDLSIGGSTWKTPQGETIDIIESNEKWVYKALKEPNIRDNRPIIALPYLVLMKLKSGRMQDIADITRMTANADENELSNIKIVIQKYFPSAFEDLESMIELGKLEKL